jgi:hypothetical protein
MVVSGEGVAELGHETPGDILEVKARSKEDGVRQSMVSSCGGR